MHSENPPCLAVKSASDRFSRARFISSTHPSHKQLTSNGRSLSCESHCLNSRQKLTSQISRTWTLLSGSYDSPGEANDGSSWAGTLLHESESICYGYL